MEKNRKNTIRSHHEIFDNINEEDGPSCKNVKEQVDMCAYQLKSYLRTYTAGELHARVVQADSSWIMELMREIIYKGRDRNPNKLVDLTSKELSPPRAHKVSELNNILKTGNTYGRASSKRTRATRWTTRLCRHFS